MFNHFGKSGFHLTTAEILYYLPDHPSLLQTYVWQNYDFAPKFPQLQQFLKFWHHELEGQLHQIQIAHRHLNQPVDVNIADGHFTLQ